MIYCQPTSFEVKRINPKLQFGAKEVKPTIDKPKTSYKNYIINFVCDYYDLKFEDLVSSSHKTEFVEPRQFIMFFLYVHTTLTLKEVGQVFKRHYTTVIYARHQIDNLCFTDKRIKSIYEIFKKEFQSVLLKTD